MASNMFCGCITTRTASICIGLITLILYIPSMYITIKNMYELQQYKGHNATSVALYVFPSVILSIMGFSISSTLITGILKRKPGLMFPWLAYHYVTITLGFLIAITINCILASHLPPLQTFVIGLISLSIAAIVYYCWNAVYRYYKSLMNGTEVSRAAINQGQVLKVASQPGAPYYKV